MALFNRHPSTGASDAREDAIHCAPDRRARLLPVQEWRRVPACAGTADVVSAQFPVRGPIAIGDASHCVATARMEHRA
ncbi:hypothetical protein ACF3M1_15290 [Luteimonas sp. WGS1318]|uniref:hypothetical protein n=1 Tax=Luteimonas sp. WGS1318 TaxID=3366815 RepID=UPI00372D7332